MWECRTMARSPALSSGAMADGDEVERAVQVALPEDEIGAVDRGREAVVKRSGEVKRLVEAIPAELQRQLVGPQLAGMEEAVDLDPGEVGLAELAELPGAVLAHVPGVVGLLGSGGSEGEQVRRRDIGDATGPEHRAEVLEDRAGVLDVLDCLQEDDRVAGLGEALHQVALEAQVGTHVAQAGVL